MCATAQDSTTITKWDNKHSKGAECVNVRY